MDIAALVDDLIASGAQPGVAARVVAEAFVAGHQATPYRETAEDRRKAKDRERKKAERDAAKASSVDNPQTSTDSVDSTDDADDAEIGSLSPVPLLSPIPPNNPLTPKPSKKTNSRGSRMPADWTMSGPDLAYALSKNLSEREAIGLFERFCSWAWSASGPNAVKVNWHQAWQGWVQRDGPKIIAARAGPVGKPLTEHQQKQREAKDILGDLQDFGTRRGYSSQQDPGLLRYDPGDRSEGFRGGSGGDLVDLSAGGRREGG